jgi:tyrosyl-tRNA synthetase
MPQNYIEELRWRGMLHDAMPGTEAALNQQVTPGYVGFDPTASSLHIGNFNSIMLLRHFQECGHKPIALVGGATGMVGDPSGKSAERNLLSEEVLRHNQECIGRQLARFLDFEPGPTAAQLVNNYDWFKDMGFLPFLRDVGKHLTISYMMAKDSVKNRLETGISFTEFSYQLLQGYDFYYLYQHMGVRVQMGGSDQWGNITSGTELIRRMGGGEAYAVTSPLITKADGRKFGKSESGNIWLDATLTSPYKFYQFFLNLSDEEAPRLLRCFTRKGLEEITSLEIEHAPAPHLRVLQKALAEDVTLRVHGPAELQQARNASEILFGKQSLEVLQSLDENTLLAVFEGVPQIAISPGTFLTADIITILSQATEATIFESKGEARKMIQQGGLSLNGEKVEDATALGQSLTLLLGRYLLVKKGKKNYYLVIVAD